MKKCLIICRSITFAQNIMYYVTQNGLYADIFRTPAQIRLNSCSYSVLVYEKDLQYIKNQLNSKNIFGNSIYQITDGNYEYLGVI